MASGGGFYAGSLFLAWIRLFLGRRLFLVGCDPGFGIFGIHRVSDFFLLAGAFL